MQISPQPPRSCEGAGSGQSQALWEPRLWEVGRCRNRNQCVMEQRRSCRRFSSTAGGRCHFGDFTIRAGISVEELDGGLPWRGWECEEGDSHPQVFCTSQLTPGNLSHLCIPTTHPVPSAPYLISPNAQSSCTTSQRTSSLYLTPFPHHMHACPSPPHTHTCTRKGGTWHQGEAVM